MTDLQIMRATLKALSELPCTFHFCEGSHKGKVEDMKTCRKCWAEHDLREHLKTRRRARRVKP